MIKNRLDSIPEGSEDNIFVDSADFRDAALGRRDRRDLAECIIRFPSPAQVRDEASGVVGSPSKEKKTVDRTV